MTRKKTLLRPPTAPITAQAVPEPLEGDALGAARLGEWLRRLALGLTAALISARAAWPSELDLKAEASSGLGWTFWVLLTLGVALAAALCGGRLRLRWSWTDAAVIVLWAMIGLSVFQASGRRVAINLAWEWGAVALLYLLVRNLPRNRDESSVLAAALVATAAAVAIYGLWQAAVEYPMLQHYYRANPRAVLLKQGITPGTPAQLLFEKRLLHSTEPMATFALTNSLAGFLVGPLVLCLALGWEAQRAPRPGAGRVPLGALVLAAVPALAILVCLLLTKSRSAYLGLAAGLAVLVVRQWRPGSGRRLILVLAGVAIVIAGLVVAGLATGKLDREVLSEAPRSIQFRQQYWVGAWGAITENSRVFWLGHGPGGFSAAYLRHKLPEASEDILDPHNLVLDIWATAGARAALALLAALGFAFWNLFRPSAARSDPDSTPGASASEDDAAPPALGAGWLLASAGGGWLLVFAVGDSSVRSAGFFDRWVILALAWVCAVLFGSLLWRRVCVPAAGLGAAALALVVNLLAAGGIAMPAVALMLWLLIALGLNLREDRLCARQRAAGGRLAAFGLAAVWAALLGTFLGAVRPFWESEAAIAEAEAWMKTRPPQLSRAEEAFGRAIETDHYSTRALLGLAYLYGEQWQSRGSKPSDFRWKMIPATLLKAAERNPTAWTLHRDRALVSRDLLAQLGEGLSPQQAIALKANITEGFRTAARLNPTSAALHAQLAEASAEIGMVPDAATEAREALRLDRITPHADRKLPAPVRKQLERELPGWEKAGGPSLMPAPGGASKKP